MLIYVSRYLLSELSFSHSILAPVIACYCCPCCTPHKPEFCCDLCHPNHWQPPSDIDPYIRPVRCAPKYNPKAFTTNTQQQTLRSHLVDLRSSLADEVLPKGGFVSPQAVISTKLLDHIIGLAHEQKLRSLEALRQQILGWAFLDSHGLHIFELIQQFCPPPSSSPFTTVPLQR